MNKNYDWEKGFDFISDYLVDIFESYDKRGTYKYKDNDDSQEITLVVPGVKKEDIEVSFKKENNTSLVFIEIKEDSLFYPKGKKTFSVANYLDLEKMSAKLKDGILTITIPKDTSKVSNGKVNIE